MSIQIDDKPLEDALLRFGADQAIPTSSKAAIASGLLRASLRERGYDVDGRSEAAGGSSEPAPAQPDHGNGPSSRDPNRSTQFPGNPRTSGGPARSLPCAPPS